MDFENIESENDFILQAYSETVDLYYQRKIARVLLSNFLNIFRFEQTEANFCSNGEKDFRKLLKELKNCYRKIEFLIALETENSSTDSCFLFALFQQQLNMLIEVVEALAHYTGNWKRAYSLDGNKNHWQKQTFSKNEITRIIADTIETPKINGLNEIVGLQEVKKNLRSLVILPKTQPQLFYGRHICNTILLFGPPGTGKTRLAHALAAESYAKFYCISASDVLSQYVGQTEKTIKTLFGSLKRDDSFSILFIDEIDSFCRKRSGNEQEYTRRIKTELMCQMSNVEGYTNLLIICATNCPWDLDSAILRRFQKRIYVPLPNQLERFEFFQYFQQDLESESLEKWIPLLNKTAGYSGSDLANVVQTALNIPLSELEDTIEWGYSVEGFYEPVSENQVFSDVIYAGLSDLPENSVKARRVRMSDFLKAADDVMCTVSPDEVKKYELFVGKQ